MLRIPLGGLLMLVLGVVLANSFSFALGARQERLGRRAERVWVGMKAGQSCIDCHKGVAHALPAEGGEAAVDAAADHG